MSNTPTNSQTTITNHQQPTHNNQHTTTNHHQQPHQQSGAKYALAARPDLAPSLLPRALPALSAAIADREDAVQAAAADALAPAAPRLRALDARGAARLRGAAWRMVRAMGELSAACASAMALLAALHGGGGGEGGVKREVRSVKQEITFEFKEEMQEQEEEFEGQQQQQQQWQQWQEIKQEEQGGFGSDDDEDADADAALPKRLPLLWRYLRHPLTSVRHAAARCLERLATGCCGDDGGTALAPVLGPTLRLVFQAVVMEADARVRAQLLATWRALLAAAGGARAAAAVGAADVAALVALAATPVGARLDPSLLVAPDGAGGVAPLRTAAAAAGGTATTKRSAPPSPPPPLKKRRGGSRGQAKYVDDGSDSDGGSGDDDENSLCGGNRGGKYGLGSGYDPDAVVGADGPDAATAMRLSAAAALADLAAALAPHAPGAVPGALLPQLQGGAATGRLLAALTLNAWLRLAAADVDAKAAASDAERVATPGADGQAALLATSSVARAASLAERVPPALADACLQLLSSATPAAPRGAGAAGPYAEAAGAHAAARRAATAALRAAVQAGARLQLPPGVAAPDALSPEQALAVLEAAGPPAAAARAAAAAAVRQLQALEAYLHGSCTLALASAAAASGRLPDKLTPVLGGLMQSLRREPAAALQRAGGGALAELLLGCAPRSPCPNGKVLKNLAAMAAGDAAETPQAGDPKWAAADEEEGDAGNGGGGEGERRATPAAAASAAAAAAGRGGGAGAGGSERASPAPSAVAAAAEAAAAAAAAATDTAGGAATQTAATLARRGAELAFAALAGRFGVHLFALLPALWEAIAVPLGAGGEPAPGSTPTTAGAGGGGDAEAPVVADAEAAVAAAAAALAPAEPQAVIDALQLVKCVLPHASAALLAAALRPLLPPLAAAATHAHPAVRAAAARAAAALAAAAPAVVLPRLLALLLPGLDGARPVASRRGVAGAVGEISARLGTDLVPFVVLLVVPLLRRMSDADAAVRRGAARGFGRLVALLPLAQSMPIPGGLDARQRAAAEADWQFLLQLLDNRRVGDYDVPVPLKVRTGGGDGEGDERKRVQKGCLGGGGAVKRDERHCWFNVTITANTITSQSHHNLITHDHTTIIP